MSAIDKRLWSKKARTLTPYVSGEQPKRTDIIKLNTNENPYPPSPAALAALAGTSADSLRRYPPAGGGMMRETAARLHGVPESHIFCGNGSDDVLAIAFMAFFDDETDLRLPEISYSFYPVWAKLNGAKYKPVAVRDDFSIDTVGFYGGSAVIANPNAPTGLALPLSAIEDVIVHADGVVIVDEAYIAFGGESADVLTSKYDNVLVVRTLSKSHALAGLRAGYAIGSEQLIAAMEAIRDSFNSYPVDASAQRVASAALADMEYTSKTVAAIKATREASTAALSAIGFEVVPSSTNFVFCKPPTTPAQKLYAALRDRGIFVRWFSAPRVCDYIRITVGTDEEMARLLEAIRELI